MKNGLKIDTYGRKFWYKDDQLHREDGPAVEYSNGTKYWYLNGVRHREDGPAVECINGTKWWFINDEPHREDGPAVEYVSGYKEWYYHGKYIGCSSDGITNEKFLKLIKLKAFW